jgi:hypothetical protein
MNAAKNYMITNDLDTHKDPKRDPLIQFWVDTILWVSGTQYGLLLDPLYLLSNKSGWVLLNTEKNVGLLLVVLLFHMQKKLCPQEYKKINRKLK